MSVGDEALVRFVSPDVRTRRGQLDVHYRQRAISVLRDVPGLTWLFDPAAIEQGDGGRTWRPGILAALGRIRHPAFMVAFAQELCRLQPSTKEAIRMLRRWRRGGRVPMPDTEQLAGEVRRCVNDYLARRPDTSYQQVMEALATVYSDTSAAACEHRVA